MPILSAFGAAKTLGGPGASVAPSNWSFVTANDSARVTGTPYSQLAVAYDQDYTVQFFIYLNSGTISTSYAIFNNGYAGSSLPAKGFYISVESSGRIEFSLTSSYSISGPAISRNQWVFVTITRATKTLRMFYDTTEVAGPSTSRSAISPTRCYIGNDGRFSSISGKVSNFRYLVGQGYTSISSVPTSPLQVVTNASVTKLLTLQDSTFIDNSGNGMSLVGSGGASMTNVGPF